MLKVGFDVLDCASFASPKAIPQMADSSEVLAELNPSETQLLAIIANVRGAENAVNEDKLHFLGYPFSISEAFQKRNTNKSIAQSIEVLKSIEEISSTAGKKLVVYLSMGFGNPYGEEWSLDIVKNRVNQLAEMGIEIISLSDTVGSASKEDLEQIFKELTPMYPHIEFGAHLHCKPYEWKEKLEAAYNGGCNRFDGAIRGFGGCPMAEDDLTGNMQTESIISLFKNQLKASFSYKEFDQSLRAADVLFH